VVLGILAAGAIIATYLSGDIRETIASELAQPNLLKDSKVTAGNPFYFAFDGGGAELKLSPSAGQRLLDSKPVFNDCDSPRRICYSPLWTKKYSFDIDGIRTPPDALCAWSSSRPDGTQRDVHTICIDPKTDNLYYLDWSLGGR